MSPADWRTLLMDLFLTAILVLIVIIALRALGLWIWDGVR